MNRGKSQIRSNKLSEITNKRTLDKMTKLSRTKKEHRQERTPRKQMLQSQSDHLDKIQSLVKLLMKKADDKQKQLLNQFTKSVEREKKIRQILFKNEDRFSDLKSMIVHLSEEQRGLIEKLNEERSI